VAEYIRVDTLVSGLDSAFSGPAFVNIQRFRHDKQLELHLNIYPLEHFSVAVYIAGGVL
jgi:hypothetical protein